MSQIHGSLDTGADIAVFPILNGVALLAGRTAR
jgi:hypothetical protein